MLTLIIPDVTYQSLLRCPCAKSEILEMAHLLQVSALFPVFAVLEGQTKGSYKGAIDAQLAPLTLWVTESRVDSLRGMVARLLASLSVPEGASINTEYIKGFTGNGCLQGAEGRNRLTQVSGRQPWKDDA